MDPFGDIQKTIGLNRQAAILTAGGYIVISAAIALLQRLNDQHVTFWPMLGALVGLILFMMFLAQTPLVVRRGVGSTIAILFAIWAVAVVGSALAPKVLGTSTYCLATLNLPERCQVSSALATADIEPQETITSDTSPLPSTAEIPNTPVYIQFAGYARQTIIEIATRLVDDGWNVMEAYKGGERTANADNMAEVRYFNAADSRLAEALAASLSAAMEGSPTIAVKDLSNSRYAKDPNKSLEIWIGE